MKSKSSHRWHQATPRRKHGVNDAGSRRPFRKQIDEPSCLQILCNYEGGQADPAAQPRSWHSELPRGRIAEELGGKVRALGATLVRRWKRNTAGGQIRSAMPRQRWSQNKRRNLQTRKNPSYKPAEKSWRALGESNPSCKIENFVGPLPCQRIAVSHRSDDPV
jgi:hypothetical protein